METKSGPVLTPPPPPTKTAVGLGGDDTRHCSYCGQQVPINEYALHLASCLAYANRDPDADGDLPSVTD